MFLVAQPHVVHVFHPNLAPTQTDDLIAPRLCTQIVDLGECVLLSLRICWLASPNQGFFAGFSLGRLAKFKLPPEHASCMKFYCRFH